MLQGYNLPLLPLIPRLFSIPRVSWYKNTPVIPKVTASVTGAAIHTPVMPKRKGRVKIQSKRTIKPREKDITAEAKALPVAVK